MSHPTEVRDLYPSSPLGETDGDVPTGRDVEWEPLVDYRRNGVSETTIHGAIAWYSGGKIIHSFGGCLLYTSPSPRDATLSRMAGCS